MIARKHFKCTLGNRCVVDPVNYDIWFGQEITWDRRNPGTHYHIPCFIVAKGIDSYNPPPRPDKVDFAPINVEDDDNNVVNEDNEVEVIPPKIELKPLVVSTANGEIKHFLYPLLFHYISERTNCYLYSSPGSGKSYAAAQAAKELGLKFAYVSLNPQSPASVLTGFMNYTGEYVATAFYDCYKHGGVFCVDELDNASASFLTTLNGALASDQASFPNGMIAKHPDFIFIGNGNTTGRGPDWQFPERRKIDEATLDRLTFIEWEYDIEMERNIAKAINPLADKWIDWVIKVRTFCGRKENGIKGGVFASPRASYQGAKDIRHIGQSSHFTFAKIADRVVFKGIDKDIKDRILANCPLPISY